MDASSLLLLHHASPSVPRITAAVRRCSRVVKLDPDHEALFEPAATQAPVDAPELAVGCFFPDIIAGLPVAPAS